MWCPYIALADRPANHGAVSIRRRSLVAEIWNGCCSILAKEYSLL